MMLSPETYYEYNLKGKNAKQIMREIDSLKKEIRRLKKTMERSAYVYLMDPGEDVQLWCTRLYLEKAKEALAEVGGTYKPDTWEVKAAEFDENILHICKLEFSTGGYFNGYDILIYTIDGNDVYRSSQHYYRHIYTDMETGKNIDLNAEEFFCGLAELHLGEWKSQYVNNDVLDGTEWHLEIHYSNGCKPVRFYGSNAYPYNFDKLLEFVGCDCKYKLF